MSVNNVHNEYKPFGLYKTVAPPPRRLTDDIGVSREWLADHRDEVAIVDVRDAWEYDGIGHIPGAVNIPFDTFRSEADETEGILPGEEAFAEIISARYSACRYC
jgi:3-mercaptopyruvate sulfurtransferase SseA